jgi:predicted nucleic acid-binding protein
MIHGLDTGFLVAAEVREHADARETLAQVLSAGDVIAVAPQVLAEFIHVVTDPRRFTQPLDMNAARHVAEQWWTSNDVVQARSQPWCRAAIFHVDAAVLVGPQASAGYTARGNLS